MTLPELQTLGQTEEGKDRLRQMLCELRGWKFHGWGEAPVGAFLTESFGWVTQPKGSRDQSIPDYPRDLNAVADVESQVCDTGDINDRDHVRYAYSRHIYNQSLVPSDRQPFRATATQRTIALICVLQKP